MLDILKQSKGSETTELWGIIPLRNYAMPSFCTFAACYAGTAEDLLKFAERLSIQDSEDPYNEGIRKSVKIFVKNGHQTDAVAEKMLRHIEPAQLIHKSRWEENEIADTMINAWGYPYSFRADHGYADIVYLKYGKSFVRCIRAGFQNLRVVGRKFSLPDRVVRAEEVWGHPGILGDTENALVSCLYYVERSFSDGCKRYRKT